MRDIVCIASNKQRFMSSVPGYDSYRTKSATHIWGTEESECDCLPDCENRIYIVHSTSAKLSTRETVDNQQFFNGKPLEEHSSISIFYKDLTAARAKRDVSTSWSTIFGLFGGLLGLCLGFTFIAVFDVIYTFTIRLGIDVYKKKEESKMDNQVLQTPKHKAYNRQNTSFNVLPAVDNPKNFISQDVPLGKNRKKGDIWFIN